MGQFVSRLTLLVAILLFLGSLVLNPRACLEGLYRAIAGVLALAASVMVVLVLGFVALAILALICEGVPSFIRWVFEPLKKDK